MLAYAQFMEAAGARVIPLIKTDSQEVTLDKLSKLNGVLFPGGDGDYLEFGRVVFNKIKEYNDNGTYYPAWGTCLGFEDFVIYAADEGEKAMELFVVENASLPLKFVKDPRKSKMFKWLNNKAFAFEDNAFAYNAHNFGVSPAKFETDEGLKEMFEVISTSKMPGDNATEFVTTFEGRKYPFFATGFHPEMTSQTWRVGNGVNHSWQSI